jgi:polysaccharide biosynthesis transport protein
MPGDYLRSEELMSHIKDKMQTAKLASPSPQSTVVVSSRITEKSGGGQELRRIARDAEDGAGFDIFEPLRILLRRRVCLYIAVPAFLVLAVLASVLMPAKYVATSRLQLVTNRTGQLSVGDSASANAEVFDSFTTLQTDVTLMQSDTLALQVIRELKLADRKEFAYKPQLQSAEVKRQMALPLEQAPLKRAAILAKFQSGLRVDILPGSRLIAVSYSSPNPELAALIVNRLVSDFVDYDIQVRYNTTMKATSFLRRQLMELKSEVEESQQRAVNLQKASGIFGTDQAHSLIDSGLEELNQEVLAAEANRVTKQTIYNMARNGSPEAIADLVGASSRPGGSQGAQNWVPLISHLKQELDDLNVQYAQAVNDYGSAHPLLIQMKQQREALQSSIQAELGKVVDSANGEYTLALSQEKAARNRLAEREAVASQMNDRAIAYNIAKNEADSSRTLYNNLLQKLKEAELLAGLRSSPLNVVDSAAVPGNLSKPRLRTFLMLGLLGGIVVGILAAFLFEATDHRVRSLQEIENATQTPLLGVIPQHELSRASGPNKIVPTYTITDGTCVLASNLSALARDGGVVAEAFRWVRSSLVLQGHGRIPRTFTIASANAGEGKSFTALNFAAVLTQSGSKVLLVDADLRRANLTKILNRESQAGFTEVLKGLLDPLQCAQIDAVSGLWFMPAGALLQSPVDLLGSTRMLTIMEAWRREFTHVVIDTPPLLPVVDGLVLSQLVDSVVLVARSAFTQRDSLSRAVLLLRRAGVTDINVLANAVGTNSGEYSQFYGQYQTTAV